MSDASAVMEGSALVSELEKWNSLEEAFTKHVNDIASTSNTPDGLQQLDKYFVRALCPGRRIACALRRRET